MVGGPHPRPFPALLTPADPASTTSTLLQLQPALTSSWDGVGRTHKEIYTALNRYGKALDRKFKPGTTPTAPLPLPTDPALLNRATAMHLIREGAFDVAQTFAQEAGALGIPSNLEPEFTTLYSILAALDAHNLSPAIAWAGENAPALDARGSTLAFELHKLEFIGLYLHDPPAALRYIAISRRFAPFASKHAPEIAQLITAFAFPSSPSPYAHLFVAPATQHTALRALFIREFCGLLGLADESPLYIAATAGAIALPTLTKMGTIMKEKRTEWTSENELPVEIPLPRGMRYHSVFVCPVSKEQGTLQNPPMMLPCGHVIARDSLQRLAKGGGGIKCPYCPRECTLSQARVVVI